MPVGRAAHGGIQVVHRTPAGYAQLVSHTMRSRKKLLHRVRRLAGQVRAVERALEEGQECARVLQTIAACRGALTGLLAEVVEGHVREHVAAPNLKSGDRAEAAEELLEIVRAYVK
jgi:DNA-binding FrmR family transcriptional regulator